MSGSCVFSIPTYKWMNVNTCNKDYADRDKKIYTYPCPSKKIDDIPLFHMPDSFIFSILTSKWMNVHAYNRGYTLARIGINMLTLA